MLTIVFKDKQYTIVYRPNITLNDLKYEISLLINVNAQNIKLYYNNYHLSEDNNMVSTLFTENSKITVIEEQPDIIMDNPLIKNMLKNPENLKGVLNMFPELKKEIESNQEIKEMINNGTFQSEMEKLVENPAYFKQVMKSADREMIKIGNQEGGYNRLSHALNNINGSISNAFKNDKNVFQGEQIHGITNEPIEIIGKRNEKENLLIKYVLELEELRMYGFRDIRKNAQVLKMCSGDVEQAMLILAEENEKN